MKRPGKPEGPHYLVHETTDIDHGVILGVTVTGGNSSDAEPYLKQSEEIHEKTVTIQAAAADSAYRVPMFYRVLGDLGIDFYMPHKKNAERTEAEFKRKDFINDPETVQLSLPGRKPPAASWPKPHRQRLELVVLGG